MRVGIDIVEVKRINRVIKNKRFLERVYTPSEIKYCEVRRNRAQHYAVRFATKEAVWKALEKHTFGKHTISHRDIGVNNLPSGRPEVTICGKKQKNMDISLSHTDNYAVAVVVIR